MKVCYYVAVILIIRNIIIREAEYLKEPRRMYRHTPFYCASKIILFFFKQIQDLWQCYLNQVYWHHLFKNLCSLHVSVSHFGNSPNFSNFFIIIISVMVICDQSYLMSLL